MPVKPPKSVINELEDQIEISDYNYHVNQVNRSFGQRDNLVIQAKIFSNE
jgi:hypothetical protein